MDRDLKRAKLLISLAQDGRLTDEEQRFLEQAVLRYPELELDSRRYERLHDLLGMVPAASAPADIERRVLESIRPEETPAVAGRIVRFPGWRGWRLPVEIAGAMAAAVIIVFVVLLSYPRLTGTADKMAAVTPDMSETSTASVPVGDGPPSVAEDVALVPKSGENTPSDGFRMGAVDDTVSPYPEVDKKTFSSEITPSGVITSAGVTAEKVSRIIIPPRETPLSAAKKEVPMISTTFISSPSERPALPTILLIYHHDPKKAQEDIMEKAVSLGGTVTRMETECYGEERETKSDSDREAIMEEDGGDMINLPPEKIGELLDYLASRYSGIDKEVADIKADEATLFIRIDVVPTIQ